MTRRPGLVTVTAAVLITAFGVAAAVTDPPTNLTLAPAQATDGFSFSWGSGRVNGPIGTPVVVHEESVASHGDFAGRDCTLTGTVNASPSVHPGNVLRIAFNGVPVDVLAVEDVANQEQSFSGSGVLEDVIRFTVTLGDGDASPNFQTTSITGTASVSCQTPPPTVPPTTPTSTPSTSSSVPPTSTTGPSSTTSEPPSSTTTMSSVPSPSSTTAPNEGSATTTPPSSPASSSTSTGSDRCPPGTYSIGAGACAAVVESGASDPDGLT